MSEHDKTPKIENVVKQIVIRTVATLTQKQRQQKQESKQFRPEQQKGLIPGGINRERPAHEDLGPPSRTPAGGNNPGSPPPGVG